MSSSIPESSPIHHLIALRSQFEQQATEAEAKATTLREQIKHVNALLLHQLAPAHGIKALETLDETAAPELFLSAQADSPMEQEDLALNAPESLSLDLLHNSIRDMLMTLSLPNLAHIQ